MLEFSEFVILLLGNQATSGSPFNMKEVHLAVVDVLALAVGEASNLFANYFSNIQLIILFKKLFIRCLFIHKKRAQFANRKVGENSERISN